MNPELHKRVCAVLFVSEVGCQGDHIACKMVQLRIHSLTAVKVKVKVVLTTIIADDGNRG